jgi:citrate/tricarballylate utilization protein
MVSLFAPVFLWAVLALSIGVIKFWRDVTPATSGAPLSTPAAAEGVHDALKLKYLGGGHGDGCNNEDDAFTLARKRMHHLTFYGFMLCFAATSVATVYHYALGWQAPYDFSSLPKILGTVGGIALAWGTLGLWRLNLARDPNHGDVAQRPMDRGFIALLFLISVTGLALMLSRNTAAMPSLLALHLGTVMALFLTLPYGKFAHGIFRTASLLRFAVEKRQPSKLALGSD